MERVSVGDALAADIDRDLARPHRHVAAAEDAVGGRAADHDARRQPLVGGGLRGGRRASPSASTCRSITSFRRLHLFPATHPCYAGDLGTGVNPKLVARVKAADLVLLVGGRHGRDAEPGLHAARHPESEDEARPRPSGPGRARPRLPARPRDQCGADRVRGRARRAAAAERDPLARRDQGPRTTITSPGPSSRPSSRAR